MRYDMKRPCPKCPFRRGGPMRLRRGRVVEIAALFDGEHGSQGGTFPCHETLDYDTDDGEAQETEKTMHCAGALAFAENHGYATQMMRIAERIGMYDARALEDRDAVWESTEEWLEHGTV